MTKKEFYDYAIIQNRTGITYPPQISAIRDERLKNERDKVLEIVEHIKSTSPFRMTFEKCLYGRKPQHDWCWSSIYLPQIRTYIFVVDSEDERDLIYQLYSRYLNILIFDDNSTMDFVGEEIIRKIELIETFKKNKA